MQPSLSDVPTLQQICRVVVAQNLLLGRYEPDRKSHMHLYQLAGLYTMLINITMCAVINVCEPEDARLIWDEYLR